MKTSTKPPPPPSCVRPSSRRLHPPLPPSTLLRLITRARMALVAPRPPFARTNSFDTSSSCDLKASSEANFDGDLPVTDELPSAALLQECGELVVFSADGKPHAFKSLFSNADQNAERHLIVFVRHFFCGMCQDYLHALSTAFTPSLLASATPKISLSIIGCGQPSLIEGYAKNTGCPFPIYADPTRALYGKLKMTVTLDLGPVRPKYLSTSLPGMALKSIIQGISTGSGAFKGGNMRQAGGEFLFDGAGKLKWCHRMRNTRDHTEIDQLAKMLELSVQKS